ncbi:hypothetical protein [Cellulomonas persica]|uniref:Uncharacterized protein n=1 Tax=Cellulomonas persica TaxID=76861 RepID=A0A510UVY4_9CELL|nr:hypothetical protein [Cellulomonas persica]GEK18853.1 hypothetical protein CPE01_25860 [Cellulomonas persica]
MPGRLPDPGRDVGRRLRDALTDDERAERASAGAAPAEQEPAHDGPDDRAVVATQDAGGHPPTDPPTDEGRWEDVWAD